MSPDTPVARYLADPDALPGLLDADGFLLGLPLLEHRLGEALHPAADFLAGATGAAVLGEPGLGKSTLLRSLKYSPDLTVHRLDLAVDRDIDGTVKRLVRAVDDDGIHVLQIDSLEEAGPESGRLARLLQLRFGNAAGRLRLHVACRAAEWPDVWQETLSSVTGSATVLALAPFTREDAAQWCQSHGLSAPEADQLVRKAGPFAAVPLTLSILLRDSEAGEAASDLFQLYDRQIDRLLKEPDLARDTPQRIESDAVSRRRVARTVAATSILTGSPGVALKDDAAGVVQSVVAHAAGVPVSAINEVVQAALFRVTGDGVAVLAHRTYGEFLAAEYLSESGATCKQVSRVLVGADGAVVPQLRGVLRWLAVRAPANFGPLLAANPEAALDQEVPLTPEVARDVVAALLERTRQGHLLDLRGLIFESLAHPGLAGQLRPVIASAEGAWPTRRLALRIARQAKDLRLIPDCLALAQEAGRDLIERQQAAYFVAEAGDHADRRALLAVLDDPTDRHAELKGTALAAWPELISTAQILPYLDAPPGSVGAYKLFLMHRLPTEASKEDLPSLIEHAGRAMGAWSDHYDATVFLGSLLQRAAGEDATDLLVEAVATALLNSDPRGGRLDVGAFHQHDPPYVWPNALDRQRLFAHLIARERGEPSSLPDPIKLPIYVAGLRHPDDLEFWCASYEDTAADRRASIGQIIMMIFDPTRPAHRDLLADKTYPSVRSDIFDQLPSYPDPSKELSTSAVEGLVQAPPQLTAGQLNWRQCMEVMSPSHGGRRELDPTQTAMWGKLDGSIRGQLIELAKAVVEVDRLPETDFVRARSRSLAQIAITQAVVLVQTAAPDAMAALSTARLVALAPFVVAGPFEFGESDIQLVLFDLFTSRIRDAVWSVMEDVLDAADSSDVFVLRVLDLVQRDWDATSAQWLRSKARELRPDSLWTSVIEVLITQGDQAVVEDVRAACTGTEEARRTAAVTTLLRHFPAIALTDFAELAHDPARADTIGQAIDPGEWPGLQAASRAASFDTLVAAARWAARTYPSSKDQTGPVFSGADLGAIRRSAVAALAASDDPRAPDALRDLANLDPVGAWNHRATADETAERQAGDSWTPLTWGEIQEVLSGTAGPIHSESDLHAAVLEALRDLDSKWLRQHSKTRSLWNDAPRRPKDEDALSDLIRDHLDGQLRDRGVIVNREVPVRRQETGIGERPDILVSANPPTNASPLGAPLSVVVEVKGVWNSGLKSDMDTQLGRRYLQEVGGRHGIYVVGWYEPTAWDANDSRRRRAQRWTRDRLADEITTLTKAAAHRLGVVMDAVVLDCSWPGDSKPEQEPLKLDEVRALRQEILGLAMAHHAGNVAVFGSVARGEATSRSDVDFLVDFDAEASLQDQVRLTNALQDLLGRPVDVISRRVVRGTAIDEAIAL